MAATELRLSAILYLDLVGFRELLQRDARQGLDILSAYADRVTAAASAHHGSVAKTDGAGMLLDFPSTVDAVSCATAVRSALADMQLNVRGGLHLGEIYFREHDAVGDGVSIAEDLCRKADPNAVLVSDAVKLHITGHLAPEQIYDAGNLELPSVQQTVHAHQLFEPRRGASAGASSGAQTGSSDALRAQVLDYIRRNGQRPRKDELTFVFGPNVTLDPPALQYLIDQGLIRESTGGSSEDRARTQTAGDMARDVARDAAGNLARGVMKGLKRILASTGKSDAEVYQAYLEEFRGKVNRQRAGLAGHTTSYFGVNLMIFGLWFFTTGPGGFPWYLFPLMGWGIGYMSHRAGVSARRAELEQVERMDAPTQQQLSLHRKLWSSRRGFRSELASTGMTAALLATINIITGASFPWAVFPIGFMSLGTLAHWRKSGREQARIKDELDSSGFALTDQGSRIPGASGSAAGNEARVIREELLRDIKQLDDDSLKGMAADVKDVLETYVRQVEALSTALAEVDRLIAGIPIGELDADRRRTTERLSATSDARLRQEYERAIDQIDAQRASFSELKTEREMLSLRIETAVGALKQLRIDVARARSTRGRATASSIDDLRSRSEELGLYLNDLRAAYEDLE